MLSSAVDVLRRRITVMILISFEYFFTPTLSSSSSTSTSSCLRRLIWHEKYFFDDTQSFRLQICCNVTRLWLAQLTSDWRLDSMFGDRRWKNIDNLTLPGFDLLLSKCGNQTMLGQIVNDNCKQERGTIITLAQSRDQLPEFDQWYVTCYELRVDYRNPSSMCNVCKLDKFCTNHGRCREKFLQTEVVNATLNSFTVLLHVGDIPFDAQVNIVVSDAIEPYNTVTNERKKQIHFKSFPAAPKNKTLAYKLNDLRIDTWYTVNVCMIVWTPSAFVYRYPNISLPNEHVFCLKDEGRTLWKKNYLSKGAQSLRCDNVLISIVIYLGITVMYCMAA